jgi:hypothetical protein
VPFQLFAALVVNGHAAYIVWFADCLKSGEALADGTRKERY